MPHLEGIASEKMVTINKGELWQPKHKRHRYLQHLPPSSSSKEAKAYWQIGH